MTLRKLTVFLVRSALLTSTLTTFGITSSVNALNIVLDGEFESPVLASDSIARFFALESFGDSRAWTVLTGSVDVQRGFGFGPDGPDDQYLDLTGDDGAASAGTIFQTLITEPGKIYELSFLVNSVPNNQEVLTGLNVFWDNMQVAPTLFSSEPLNYSSFAFTLTAESETTELRFQSINGDGFGPLLDDVSVVEVAVPEPRTILGSLIALGFGALFKREFSKKKDSKQHS